MVTKEQMETYEDIRSKGLVNMFNVTSVIYLSHGILTKEVCLSIMKDYSGWMEKHNIERIN